MAARRGVKSSKKAGKVKSLRARRLDAKKATGVKGGAGAGKVKFNEFTINRTSDKASPQ
jgi:hypothetical protein